MKCASAFMCKQLQFLVFSRLLPVRVSLLQRVSGEGGHHQQPGRMSHHLVALLFFFSLRRGQVPQRGRGHPLPVPGRRVAEARIWASCAGARGAALDDGWWIIRQAPLPGMDILGEPAGSVRGQTQQAGEGPAVQTLWHPAVPHRWACVQSEQLFLHVCMSVESTMKEIFPLSLLFKTPPQIYLQCSQFKSFSHNWMVPVNHPGFFPFY